jgi:hypothetical protein
MLLKDSAHVVSAGNSTLRICPRCQSTRVFRRHRLARWQNWLSRLNYYPYRCHACNYRFVTQSQGSLPDQDLRPGALKRRIRRLIGDVVIGVICLAIFLLFLYFVSRPAPDDEDSSLSPGNAISLSA